MASHDVKEQRKAPSPCKKEKSPVQYTKQPGFFSPTKTSNPPSKVNNDEDNDAIEKGHDQVHFTDEDSDEDDDFKDFKKAAGVKECKGIRGERSAATLSKGGDEIPEKEEQAKGTKETMTVTPNFAAFTHFMANPFTNTTGNIAQGKNTSGWTNVLDSFEMLCTTPGGEKPKRLGADGMSNM